MPFRAAIAAGGGAADGEKFAESRSAIFSGKDNDGMAAVQLGDRIDR